MNKRLEVFFEESIHKRIVPGFVVIFGSPEEVVYHRAFGNRQIVPSVLPMSADTLFDVASITKSVVTASLLMLLKTKGLISFDERVKRFFSLSKENKLAEIPVSLLMCHRAGMPWWSPYFLHITRGKKARCVLDTLFLKSNKEKILNLVLSEKLVYPPNTMQVYSDVGYILLGAIIESVSNTTLEQLFHQEIAQPFGLKKTAFRPLSPSLPSPQDVDIAASEFCFWREKVLIGEVHDDNAFVMGGVSGHAGLFSTASDLFRFAAKLVKIYESKEDGPVSGEMLRECWKKIEGGSFTLGWDTPTPGKSTSGKYFSCQSVGAIGFTGCTVWIDLERRFIVVLLANRIHPTRSSNPHFNKFRQDAHDFINLFS